MFSSTSRRSPFFQQKLPRSHGHHVLLALSSWNEVTTVQHKSIVSKSQASLRTVFRRSIPIVNPFFVVEVKLFIVGSPVTTVVCAIAVLIVRTDFMVRVVICWIVFGYSRQQYLSNRSDSHTVRVRILFVPVRVFVCLPVGLPKLIVLVFYDKHANAPWGIC